MQEQKDEREKKGGDPKKRRMMELGIVMVVILAVVLIKLAAGNKTVKNPLFEKVTPSIFELYQIEIPEFDGNTYVLEMQNNEPYFKPEDMSDTYFTRMSDLDDLGRAGSNIMCADEPHIQTGERGNISELKPSGWHGGGFYQRSHLLMWKLSGLDDIRNLVTGTATFNGTNMLEYEEQVTRYLWDHPDNHVMYRVSPYYVGDELVCRGVLMEAYSIEDEGDFSYCVFIYNVEPGAVIDYATGDYMEDAENMTEERSED